MAPKRDFKHIIKPITSYLREIDITLFATVVAISLFGIINMYGISGSSGSYVAKQITIVAIGIFAMIFFSFFNYRYLKNYSFPVLVLYGVSLILLGVTLYTGTIRGVSSWIKIGSFTMEPSELAKLALIILMAKYFSQRHIHINQIRHIIISGLYYAVPVLIIMAQPDLGSAIIFSAIWFGVLLASGINKRQLFLLAIIGIIIAGSLWLFVLKPYQKDRLESFLDPHNDPQGAGYNLIQSKIAIGSGYLFGSGLGKGTQTKLGFLPEPRNDFVFASVGEQFGLVGMGLILAAIIIIISRVLAIGEGANNNFGRLFSLGVAIFIFFHAIIGASVNIGLMPVTGIPFPFLSYGGSNLISIMIGLGILQSIKRYG